MRINSSFLIALSCLYIMCEKTERVILSLNCFLILTARALGLIMPAGFEAKQLFQSGHYT